MAWIAVVSKKTIADLSALFEEIVLKPQNIGDAEKTPKKIR